MRVKYAGNKLSDRFNNGIIYDSKLFFSLSFFVSLFTERKCRDVNVIAISQSRETDNIGF